MHLRMLKTQGYLCLHNKTQPLSKNIHMSVPRFGLKLNWLSLLAKSGEMQGNKQIRYGKI